MPQHLDARVASWLAEALADAERRGLTDLCPLLESLARATEAIRAADWNDDAASPAGSATRPLMGRR